MPRSDSRTASVARTSAPRQRRERTGASERKVDRAGRLHEHRKSGGVLADPRRELADDPLDLFPLGARRLGELVVELDDCERLDEEVCPELDASCTIPGTLLRAPIFTASTGRRRAR
jgi:hypothetical protein